MEGTSSDPNSPFRRTVLCRRVKPRDLSKVVKKESQPTDGTSGEPFLDIVKLFCQTQPVAFKKSHEDSSNECFRTPRSPCSSWHPKKRKPRTARRSITHLKRLSSSHLLPKSAKSKSKQKTKKAGTDTKQLAQSSCKYLLPGCSMTKSDVTRKDSADPFPVVPLKEVASAACLVPTSAAHSQQKFPSKGFDKEIDNFSFGSTDSMGGNLEQENKFKIRSFSRKQTSTSMSGVGSEEEKGRSLKKLHHRKFKSMLPVQRVRTTVALPLTPRKEHSERINMKYEQMSTLTDEGRQEFLSAVSSDDEGLATMVTCNVPSDNKDTSKHSRYEKLTTQLQPSLQEVCTDTEQLVHPPSQYILNTCKHRTKTKGENRMMRKKGASIDTQPQTPQHHPQSPKCQRSVKRSYQSDKHPLLHRLLHVHRDSVHNRSTHGTQTAETTNSSPQAVNLATYSVKAMPCKNTGTQDNLPPNRRDTDNLRVGLTSVTGCLKPEKNDLASSSRISNSSSSSRGSKADGPMPITEVKEIIKSAPLLVKRLQELEEGNKELKPKGVKLELNVYSDGDIPTKQDKKCISFKPVEPRKSGVEQWVMGQQMEAAQEKEVPGYLKPTCSTTRRQRITYFESLERSRVLGRPCRYMNVATARPRKPFSKPHYRQLLRRAARLQAKTVKRQALKSRYFFSDGRFCRDLARRMLSTTSINELSSLGNTAGFECGSQVSDKKLIGSARKQRKSSQLTRIPYWPNSGRRPQLKSKFPGQQTGDGGLSARHKLSGVSAGKRSKVLCSKSIGRLQHSCKGSTPRHAHRLDSGGSKGQSVDSTRSSNKAVKSINNILPSRRQHFDGDCYIGDGDQNNRKVALCGKPFYKSHPWKMVVGNSHHLGSGVNAILPGSSTNISQKLSSISCNKANRQPEKGSYSARRRLGISPWKKQPLSSRHSKNQRLGVAAACKQRLSGDSGSRNQSDVDSRMWAKRSFLNPTNSFRGNLQRQGSGYLNLQQMPNCSASLQQFTSGSDHSNGHPMSDLSSLQTGCSSSSDFSDSYLAFSLNELAVLNAGDRKLGQVANSTSRVLSDLLDEEGNHSVVNKLVSFLKTTLPTLLVAYSGKKVDAASSNTQLLQMSHTVQPNDKNLEQKRSKQRKNKFLQE